MMHKRSRHVDSAVLLVLVIVLGPLLVACGPAGGGGSTDEIVIGATVPITGPLSLSGQQYYNSLQLAEDDINADGGINGQQLRIVFEDTQASNSTAVNAFNKLVQDGDPPFIFLSSYSTQNLAVEPEVSNAEIPTMYAGGAVAVAERGNPWMFRIRPSDRVAAIAMAKFVVNNLEKSKPGILYIQNDFGQGGAEVAAQVFTELGVEVVGREAYGADDKDMSAQILSLQNAGADVLLAFDYPADAALLMKQVKELGVDVPFVTSSAGYLPAALELLTPEELENTWGVVDAYLDPSKPEVQEFLDRYQERFDKPADPYAAQYYDGAMIVARALEEVGTDPEKIRDYIANIEEYQGISHVYRFDDMGEGVHDVAVVTITPGTKEIEFVDAVVVE